MAMITCRKCETVHLAAAERCGYCGEPLPSEQSEACPETCADLEYFGGWQARISALKALMDTPEVRESAGRARSALRAAFSKRKTALHASVARIGDLARKLRDWIYEGT